MAKPAPDLVIERDMIDVTQSGLLGGQPDVYRQFAPGPLRYRVDGAEVSRDEFIAAGGQA
jgi:hypothetical protein